MVITTNFLIYYLPNIFLILLHYDPSKPQAFRWSLWLLTDPYIHCFIGINAQLCKHTHTHTHKWLSVFGDKLINLQCRGATKANNMAHCWCDWCQNAWCSVTVCPLCVCVCAYALMHEIIYSVIICNERITRRIRQCSSDEGVSYSCIWRPTTNATVFSPY